MNALWQRWVNHCELDPGRPYVHLQIGLAYAGAGDGALAAQALRKAAVLNLAQNDANAAAQALRTLRAMGLEGQLSAPDLEALDNRVATLNPS
jgi:hypothetical protein